MATPDGRALGQQDDGGFRQFFRGDLPKKLGLLLVRRAAWSDVASPQIAASASREPSAMQFRIPVAGRAMGRPRQRLFQRF